LTRRLLRPPTPQHGGRRVRSEALFLHRGYYSLFVERTDGAQVDDLDVGPFLAALACGFRTSGTMRHRRRVTSVRAVGRWHCPAGWCVVSCGVSWRDTSDKADVFGKEDGSGSSRLKAKHLCIIGLEGMTIFMPGVVEIRLRGYRSAFGVRTPIRVRGTKRIRTG